MFPEKNISPKQLSFFTALALAVLVSLFILIIDHRWQSAAIAFGIILVTGYAWISFVLEKFIYRKLKLVFKFIHQTKATKKEETYYKYVLPRQRIEDVQEEVEAWAEENKQEIELLQRNEQFRKEFLQNLSHEFKTPVFAIQGYVDTLLHGALENPDVNRKFLEKAATNIERLTNLLNDLDEISKLERGELNLIKQPLIIQDLIREVYEDISIFADQKQIRCAIKKGCESPIQVFADREKIRQVLTNLVENSIKYGKTGGTITASIYNTDGRHVLVEISDDGIGIGEKHLTRIFERFYRTEGGRQLDVTGSGLGLAICKHIVEAHGQTIHVRSREGVGTSIGFTLDLRP